MTYICIQILRSPKTFDFDAGNHVG